MKNSKLVGNGQGCNASPLLQNWERDDTGHGTARNAAGPLQGGAAAEIAEVTKSPGSCSDWCWPPGGCRLSMACTRRSISMDAPNPGFHE